MPPSFSRTLQVAAIPANANAWVMWMLVLPAMGFVLGGVPALLWDVSMAWTALLMVAGLAGGAATGFLLPAGRYPGREGRAFSAQAQVELDTRGLSIEGLGVSPWHEVLAVEADHHEGTAVVVQTVRFGRLMLQAQPSDLWPAFAFHLGAGAAEDCDGSRHRFVARVFSWPAYRAWILAGYAAAIALAVLMFAHGGRGPLATLVVAAVIAPLVALLVWTLPGFNLDHFGESHRYVFEIDGTVLERGDRRWRWDLRRTEVRARIESGPTYALAFLEVKPERGRRRYLLLSDADVLHATMRRIEAAPPSRRGAHAS